MNEKDWLLGSYRQEFETTQKVLKAYPADRMHFRPHERSSSATEIAWTLAAGYSAMTDLVLGGAPDFARRFTVRPPTSGGVERP